MLTHYLNVIMEVMIYIFLGGTVGTRFKDYSANRTGDLMEAMLWNDWSFIITPFFI
jgi:hypothetical protein